jgi:hypothetical protein
MHQLPPVTESELQRPEWQAFVRELPDLLAQGHQGRFALVHGDRVVSVWDTMRDAWQAGLERFGAVPLFIYPVIPHPPKGSSDRSHPPAGIDSTGPTIPYTELPDVPVNDPLYHEWNTYRRELPGLLAEGHEGKFVLIKGESILGLFSTLDDAMIAGYARFLREPFRVQQVRSKEPLIRLPLRCSCPT